MKKTLKIHKRYIKGHFSVQKLLGYAHIIHNTKQFIIINTDYAEN